MATGTKAPAKPADEVSEVDALKAELAEVRAQSAAALEQGQQMLAAAMALVQQAQAQPSGGVGLATAKDVEPAQDDPRRNVPDPDFEPVVFRSKGVNQRIVRVPKNRLTTMNGEVQAIGGIAYDFAEGRGEFVARNATVADFLRSRPAFNLEFWEVGNEPHAAPDPQIVLDKVQTALMELDLDALTELQEKEAASHNRKIVMDQITSAQRKIAQAGK